MITTIKLTPNDIQTIKVDKDEATKLIKHYAIQYRRDMETGFSSHQKSSNTVMLQSL